MFVYHKNMAYFEHGCAYNRSWTQPGCRKFANAIEVIYDLYLGAMLDGPVQVSWFPHGFTTGGSSYAKLTSKATEQIMVSIIR